MSKYPDCTAAYNCAYLYLQSWQKDWILLLISVAASQISDCRNLLLLYWIPPQTPTKKTAHQQRETFLVYTTTQLIKTFRARFSRKLQHLKNSIKFKCLEEFTKIKWTPLSRKWHTRFHKMLVELQCCLSFF